MPQNLREWQLKFGYWFLTHKQLLKRILIIILVLINAGLWGYSIVGFTLYFAHTPAHRAQMRLLSQNLVDWRLRYKFEPEELVISSPQAIFAGKDPEDPKFGKYDFIASGENLNSRWFGQVEFQFTFSGGETKKARSFIFPAEKKHLLVLGERLQDMPRNVELELLDTRWKRLREPELEKLARLDIACENIEFTGSSVFEKDEKRVVSPARVEFQARNNTVYNFWQVRFNIILFQARKIVGAASVPIEQFLSGSTRKISATWHDLVAVTEVVVEPEVNILDPDVIMPLK